MRHYSRCLIICDRNHQLTTLMLNAVGQLTDYPESFRNFLWSVLKKWQTWWCSLKLDLINKQLRYFNFFSFYITIFIVKIYHASIVLNFSSDRNGILTTTFLALPLAIICLKTVIWSLNRQDRNQKDIDYTYLTLYGRMSTIGNNFAVGGYGILKKLDREKLIPIAQQQRIYRKKTCYLLFSSSRP